MPVTALAAVNGVDGERQIAAAAAPGQQGTPRTNVRQACLRVLGASPVPKNSVHRVRVRTRARLCLLRPGARSPPEGLTSLVVQKVAHLTCCQRTGRVDSLGLPTQLGTQAPAGLPARGRAMILTQSVCAAPLPPTGATVQPLQAATAAPVLKAAGPAQAREDKGAAAPSSITRTGARRL